MKFYIVNTTGCVPYEGTGYANAVSNAHEGILVVADNPENAVNIVQRTIEHYSERYVGSVFAKEININ